MPLTVDTGPRIYLEIDNHSDTEMRAHFTWSTMALNNLSYESKPFIFNGSCSPKSGYESL